jgi:hypothetical protein
MTPGSILLGLALFIVVVLILLYPYLSAQRQTVLTPRQQLEATKDLLLSEIRILDFDHETGKIPTDVYETQRQGLVAETARIMHQLETMPTPSYARAGKAVAIDEDADDEIEAAIAALRRNGAKKKGKAAVKSKKKGVSVASNGRFCTECGQPVKSNDKFCAACGHKLASDQ